MLHPATADGVRDMIRNFNTDGFQVLHPKYKGSRPRTFTLSERRENKKIAKSKPAEHSLPVFDLEPDQAGRFPGARWSTGRMSPDATLTRCWWSGRSAQSTVDAACHPVLGCFHF